MVTRDPSPALARLSPPLGHPLPQGERGSARAAKLGAKQLETLAALGSPSTALIVPDRIARSLVKHGLLRVNGRGSFACITPAGLRRLADALEAGHIDGALEWAAKEAAKNRARGHRAALGPRLRGDERGGAAP